MALALSSLRPLGLLTRTVQVPPLALSCLAQYRCDLQVFGDNIGLANVSFLFM